MPELCRVNIEERDHDRDTYGDVDWCAKSIAEHKALKVMLLTGLDGRLQEHLEDQFQAFADFVDNDEERVLDQYLSGKLSKKYMDIVEEEAGTLASIILG